MTKTTLGHVTVHENIQNGVNPRASEKRFVPEDRQPQHPRDEEGWPPTEAGGRREPRSGAPFWSPHTPEEGFEEVRPGPYPEFYVGVVNAFVITVILIALVVAGFIWL